MATSTDVPPPSGPLHGLRVIELAGLGPGPFAAMVLADLGAEVITVDRPGPWPPSRLTARWDLLRRGRESVAIDLKAPGGADLLLRLATGADAVIEGYRPGVAERLGIGPEPCRTVNPRLVYARMTGWGQNGPYAGQPGHDVNYIALAGALDPIGYADRPPVVPLNLVGDFGGGGMLLVVGVLAAVFEARASGQGQVVDAAMVDGAALLTTMIHGLVAAGAWRPSRQSNELDGAAPHYGVYETADGRFISLGSLEPQFYARLLAVLGLDEAGLPDREDPATWPELRRRFAAAIRSRTQQEWITRMEPAEVCFAPVNTLSDAADHPHLRARDTFVTVDGVRQSAPAPRFSRTPARITRGPSVPGQHTRAVLERWGVAPDEVTELESRGIVATAAV